MSRYAYHRPRSLEEAWRLKEAEPDARYVAGGTDLMVRIKDGTVHPRALISLRSIPELAGITVNGGLRIGAGTCIADIVAHSQVRADWPVLADACRALGSPQIRNVATIGGNLANASPCADTATPLLVLDARVELAGPRGRRTVPLTEFFRGPGETCRTPEEVVSAVFVERPPAVARTLFVKQGRVKMDLAVASVSVRLDLDGGRCRTVRVAAGSVAPTPVRLREVEAVLEGQAPSPGLFAEAQRLAASAVAPITDLRSTAEHRRTLVGVFVRRALEALTGGAPS